MITGIKAVQINQPVLSVRQNSELCRCHNAPDCTGEQQPASGLLAICRRGIGRGIAPATVGRQLYEATSPSHTSGGAVTTASSVLQLRPVQNHPHPPPGSLCQVDACHLLFLGSSFARNACLQHVRLSNSQSQDCLARPSTHPAIVTSSASSQLPPPCLTSVPPKLRSAMCSMERPASATPRRPHRSLSLDSRSCYVAGGVGR